jgi:pimeloyl-ACP methyl ester carboxylesterase
MQQQETTRYIQATDGCALAYDCTEAEGRSGGVLLVHGMGGSRLDWHKYGYVEHLAPYFSVATLDLRGHGESGAPHHQESYTLAQMLSDLRVIAHACRWSTYSIVGFSLGGRIALQAASQVMGLSRIATIGATFGAWLPAEVVTETISQIQDMARAKAEGRLATLGLAPDDLYMVEHSDLLAHLACFRAISEWPVARVAPLLCPALLLGGEADSAVMDSFHRDSRAMAQAGGISVHILPGLSHRQSLSERAQELPPLLAFLAPAV